MILANIKSCDHLKKYPEAIRKALDYILDTDFMSMEPGVYQIEGDKFYAQMSDGETKPLEEAMPEVHKNYIDVQYWVTGSAKVGFESELGKYSYSKEIPDKDVYFYDKLDNEVFFDVQAGDFMVFFPSDIHRPMVSNGEPVLCRRVIVKIHKDLIK